MIEPVPSQHESTPASSVEGAASAGKGVREDFASQFTQSFRVLWFIASGIVGDRALAEDVVQEAAMIGMEKFHQFEPGTNFTAWMGQMVRHVALNTARKEMRHQSGLKDAGAEGRLGVASSEVGRNEAAEKDASRFAWSIRGELPPDQQLFDDAVIRALGEVSAAARACLLLRTVEGLEYSEISTLLGIPEGTAMSHVHRSRQHLREKLTAHRAAGQGTARGATGGRPKGES